MNTPTIFTDLSRMRLQECDRPKCLAVELSKVGMVQDAAGGWHTPVVVSTSDYDTLYVWPPDVNVVEIVAWHRNNNTGDNLVFHLDNTRVKAEMPE